MGAADIAKAEAARLRGEALPPLLGHAQQETRPQEPEPRRSSA